MLPSSSGESNHIHSCQVFARTFPFQMGMADFTTEDVSASTVSMAVTLSSFVLPLSTLPMMEDGQRRSCLSLGFSLG